MGELQHGIYNDECEGLTDEEINALHGFSDDGDLIDGDSDQADASDSDSEEGDRNYEKSEVIGPEITVCCSLRLFHLN